MDQLESTLCRQERHFRGSKQKNQEYYAGRIDMKRNKIQLILAVLRTTAIIP